MATSNKDFPRGFWPAYTKHGGPPALRRYYTSGTAKIYRGDILKYSHTASYHGVTPWTGTSDDDVAIIGVSASYTTAAPGGSTDASAVEIFVYDDLINTVFIAQTASSVTTIMGSSTDTMKYYAPYAGSPTTASEISKMEVYASSSGIPLAGTDLAKFVWVSDKVDRPDNAWGGWVDVYCQLIGRSVWEPSSALPAAAT